MKKALSVVLTLTAVLALSNVAFGDKDGDSDSDSDRKSLRLQIGLSGAQEVSEVFTDTTGKFRIDFNKKLSEAKFVLRVNDGIGVTQAHIHCGPAGTNGPVVAFLFGLVPGGVNVDGKLSRGTLTNADIMPDVSCVTDHGLLVNNIASLALAARDGLLYVNVHTLTHPPGEVRGQIFDR